MRSKYYHLLSLQNQYSIILRLIFASSSSIDHSIALIVNLRNIRISRKGEGEGDVAVFSAKRWDRRNRADLIESATPCHDAQVVGSYRGSNPLRLTVLASKSEDYTTAPQHLQNDRNVNGTPLNGLEYHYKLTIAHIP